MSIEPPSPKATDAIRRGASRGCLIGVSIGLVLAVFIWLVLSIFW